MLAKHNKGTRKKDARHIRTHLRSEHVNQELEILLQFQKVETGLDPGLTFLNWLLVPLNG